MRKLSKKHKSKKHPSKKHPSKKHKSKKHPSKKHKSKKHKSKKHKSKKNHSKKHDGMYKKFVPIVPIEPPPSNYVHKPKRTDFYKMNLVLKNRETGDEDLIEIEDPPIYLNMTLKNFINKIKKNKGYDVYDDVYIHSKDNDHKKFSNDQIGYKTINDAIDFYTKIPNPSNKFGTIYYTSSKDIPYEYTSSEDDR